MAAEINDLIKRDQIAGHEAAHAVVAYRLGTWPRGARMHDRGGCSQATGRLLKGSQQADIAISMAGYAANMKFHGMAESEARYVASADFSLMKERYSCSPEELERGAEESRLILGESERAWELVGDHLKEIGFAPYDRIAQCVTGEMHTPLPRCSVCGKGIDPQSDRNIAVTSSGKLICSRQH